MKKIIVNKDACMGCGACVAIDPDHFEFNDDGLSQTKSNDNLDSNNLASAISSCPTGAISIDENCECDNCQCSDENNCGSH